jgi:protein ImuB
MDAADPTPDLFASLAAREEASPVEADATTQPMQRASGMVPPSIVPMAKGVVPVTQHGLWLCLFLPGLPLEALPPTATQGACAVVDGSGSQQRVFVCNRAAARRGVAPGQRLNAALALVPDLVLHARRCDAEVALLERLARWGTQFTPFVSPEPPDAMLLEVRGSLRLFGGDESLRRRAAEELQAHGIEVVASIGPTPRAALWLARAGIEEAIGSPAGLSALASRLPLALLRWPAALIESLQAIGVRTVADLLRLPRAGFARRYGPELLDELDEAFGRRPSPRRRHVAPERFDGSLELPAEFTSTAGLEPAAATLVARLATFLRVRSAGVHGLRLEFHHRGLPATRLVLGLSRPSGDEQHLMGLLRERLARTSLPAPVMALRLRSTVALPLDLTENKKGTDLFSGTAPFSAERLVERLRARLGPEAVFSICPVPEHRPERAWRITEPAEGVRPGRSRRAAVTMPPRCPSSRPVWMLAAPLPLTVRDGLPCHDGPLTLVAGPERIETGWWDGQDVRRDYYTASTPAGVRLWVYRERDTAGRWFLHGVFS